MAQAPAFFTVGCLEVPKDSEWTTADLPTITPPVDTVRIVEAPLIWRPSYEQNGTVVTDAKNTPVYTKSNQRGVRILITRSGVTYNNTNIPALYKEGEEIALHDDNTYKFVDACIVEYGIKK